MAWGYWSASSVQDRGRSPRRGAVQAGARGAESAGSGDEDYAPPLSRRPSLADIEFSGPGSAIAHVLGQGGGPRPGLSLPGAPPPGPSALPPPPPPRHECLMHHSTALVHHYQCRVHDLSPSDDEEEPTYATGELLSLTSTASHRNATEVSVA